VTGNLENFCELNKALMSGKAFPQTTITHAAGEQDAEGSIALFLRRAAKAFCQIFIRRGKTKRATT